MKFGDVDAKLISLFEYTLAPFVNEVIEPACELCHAVPEVVKAKVDAWEGVGH